MFDRLCFVVAVVVVAVVVVVVVVVVAVVVVAVVAVVAVVVVAVVAVVAVVVNTGVTVTYWTVIVLLCQIAHNRTVCGRDRRAMSNRPQSFN